VRPGATVFDVGAFSGSHTAFFAELVGPSGRVVAFEPHPDNRASILAHVERLGLTNVDLRDTPVGRRSESLEFVYPHDLGRGTADPDVARAIRSSEAHRSATLSVRSLDDATASGELPPPDLVKVDVEGLEHDVLLGMERLARRHRPALFIEMHGTSAAHEEMNYRRVLAWLLDHGYRVTHVESGRRLARAGGNAGLHAGQHLHCA
jgi:FkbM family methyltransferase